MRCIAAAALVLALVVGQASAITTKVLAGAEDCYFDLAPPGTTITAGFVVTHGGKLDIDARVTVKYQDDGAYQEITTEVKSWSVATEGHAEYLAPLNIGHKPMKMEICFSNKMSRWTPKWVNFEFYKMKQAGDDGMTGEHNKQYRELEDQLHGQSKQVYDMRLRMQKLRKVEEEHRVLVEATHSWLFYGAVGNGLMLGAMAIFQFWYLKNFLTVRATTMRI